MTKDNATLNRYIATALVALVDTGLFCALIAHGHSLQAAHIASFAVAITLNYLLKVHSAVVATARIRDLRVYGGLLAVSCMALFLRGGVLGLLCSIWGWPAQIAIVFAVVAGYAVLQLGYSLALSVTDDGPGLRSLAIGVIAYAFALRVVYLGSVELLPEEAYYWNYSRHLDIGYLDHPPMVAWLIRLGTTLFGQSQFGLRAGALGCAIVASVFTYRLARNLFGEASALAALVLVQVLPFFFLSGLLMTPDAPLTAAWAGTLYYLELALVGGHSKAWWRAGLALGIGAISKYSIALLVPVTLAFMLWDRQSRRWWRLPQPYAAALLAVAVFSPVILWNAQHEWASFAFQTSRRLAEAAKFTLHRLLASALVLITPLGVLAVAAEFMGGQPADSEDTACARRGWRFIRLAILVPLAVFAIFSLRHEVKLDWTGALWIAALPVMAVGMSASAAKLPALSAWIHAAWKPTLLSLLLIYGAGLHYLVLGFPGAGYGKHNELVPVGWRDFSDRISRVAAVVRQETGDDPVIVGMDRYVIASELAFYGALGMHSSIETSSINLFGGSGLMYERWAPPASVEGRTLLLVAWDGATLADAAIESHTERLGPVEQDVLRHDGQIVRRYFYRLAYNYRAAARP